MPTYTPQLWVVLKIATPDGEVLHKIFATWYGGYFDEGSWKLNSSNVSVEDKLDSFHVKGYSGSIYELHKEGYGMSTYTSVVLRRFLKENGIELLSEEESLEYLEGMC